MNIPEIDSIIVKVSQAKKQAEALCVLIAEITNQIKSVEQENEYTKKKFEGLRALIENWKVNNIPVDDDFLSLKLALAEEMKKFGELYEVEAEFRNFISSKFRSEIVSPPFEVPTNPGREQAVSGNKLFEDVSPETVKFVPRPMELTERNIFEEVIIGLLRTCGSTTRAELKNLIFQTLEQRLSENDLALSSENTPVWWDTARGAIYNLSKMRRISFNKDEATFRLNEDYDILKDFKLST